jgi:hypothetical protein
VSSAQKGRLPIARRGDLIHRQPGSLRQNNQSLAVDRIGDRLEHGRGRRIDRTVGSLQLTDDRLRAGARIEGMKTGHRLQPRLQTLLDQPLPLDKDLLRLAAVAHPARLFQSFIGGAGDDHDRPRTEAIIFFKPLVASITAVGS